MKQLLIGLIVAGSLAACHKASNNATDTAAGSLATPNADTTGVSGSATPAPVPGTMPAPTNGMDTAGAATPATMDTSALDTTSHTKKKPRKHY
jgi:hypothetical protein